MKNKSIFLLLFLFAILMGSCDTGEYYEILEDDTIESFQNEVELSAIDSLQLGIEEF